LALFRFELHKSLMSSSTPISFTTPAGGDKLNAELVGSRSDGAPAAASNRLDRLAGITSTAGTTLADIDPAERSLNQQYSIDPNKQYLKPDNTNTIRPTADYYYSVNKSTLGATQTKSRIDGAQQQEKVINAPLEKLKEEIKANETHPLRQDYDNFLTRREVLWINNPKQLLRNMGILFPHPRLSWEGKVNAVTRFVLVATLGCYAAFPGNKYIIISGIACLIVIYAIARGAQERQLVSFDHNIQALTTELMALKSKHDEMKLSSEVVARLVPNTLDILPDNTSLPLPIASSTLDVAQRQLARLPAQDQLLAPRRDAVMLGVNAVPQ